MMFLYKLLYASHEMLTLLTENTAISFSASRSPSKWPLFRKAISVHPIRSSPPIASTQQYYCPPDASSMFH